MRYLGGGCYCHLFGCCLLPPWSLEKERPRVAVAAGEAPCALGYGVRVWQQPSSSSPVPGCRTFVVTSAVSTSRTDGSCQSSGFTRAFALFRLTLPLSIPEGEAFTYHIFSARDIMFLSNQDFEDTAVLSLGIIILQRPDFRPESGVLVRHNGRPTLQQGLSHHSPTCFKTAAQEQSKHVIKQ